MGNLNLKSSKGNDVCFKDAVKNDMPILKSFMCDQMLSSGTNVQMDQICTRQPCHFDALYEMSQGKNKRGAGYDASLLPFITQTHFNAWLTAPFIVFSITYYTELCIAIAFNC